MAGERIVKLIEDAKGRKLLVEVSQAEVGGLVKQDGEPGLFRPVNAGDQVEKFTNTLSTLISDTMSAVLDGIDEITSPSKVQVEFGVELGAEGQVWFIAKGSVSSTIKVAIEWEGLNGEPGKVASP